MWALDRKSKKGWFAPARAHRGLVQGLWTLVTNFHLPNFLTGHIHTGRSKALCVPGLNCYSCPGAAGSCPIGAFQAVVGSSKFKFSYYVTGVLIFFGVLAGRLICGFFCPFGWFQDLLHKIPGKKLSTRRLRPLRWLKYIVLVAVVWLLCAFAADKTGLAPPYFCKYLCPQGILQGALPLAAAAAPIRSALGGLFTWKAALLAAVAVLAVVFYRPFCKWLCPLGAFYSLFNKVSFYQYHVDRDACVSCGKCRDVCGMDVDITQCQTALECIRCGKCVDACPAGAISTSLSRLGKTGEPENKLSQEQGAEQQK